MNSHHSATFSEQAQNYLQDEHILFEVKNNGILLVIEGPQSYIDYYPSTGKWRTRKNEHEGFGLASLIRYYHNYQISPLVVDNNNIDYDPTKQNPSSYKPPHVRKATIDDLKLLTDTQTLDNGIGTI